DQDAEHRDGELNFAGLTAYETQRIKELYQEADDVAVAGSKAIMGALTLYLDLINLFMFLLQFMGNRKYAGPTDRKGGFGRLFC
ncbi:Bax inhibitor-1 family protein, partial [Rhizobium ruizarguesonis]